MKRNPLSSPGTSRNAASNPARAGLQRKCACGQHTAAGSECDDCKQKQSTLNRSATISAQPASVPPVVDDTLQAPGQPLDSGSRTFMESRFGHDFSNVRVHTDSQAADSATAVNALAYTVGSDVVFGSGQYAPQSQAGKHLLAHELTHVVQQESGSAGADAEAHAEHSADLVSRGRPVDQKSSGGAKVSLQKAGKDDTAGGVAAGANAPAPTTVGGPSSEPAIDEFDFDKTTIPPQHLDRMAALRAKLINAPSATVILAGHTDTVGKEKYNEGLGRRRAEAVRDFLTKNNSVNSSRIQIESMGELKPAAGQPPAKLDPNKGEKNAKNRRVEIQVTGLPSAGPASKPWSLDPANPTGKKPGPKPIDLTVPSDYKFPPVKSVDTPEPTTGPGKPEKKSGPEIEGGVVASPDGIDTTVEVTWQAKSGLAKKLGSEIKFTLHVGPKGFSQLEADLTVLKAKIKDKILGGTIRDITFSMGFNPALNLDRDKANNLVTSFSEKFKASLEADLVIPKTSIKFPFELSPTIDINGKPGFDAKVTLFKF